MNNRTLLPALRGPQDRNALVEKNLSLVPWAIFHKRPRLRKSVRILGGNDAVQEGRLSLFRAAELWDPTKGAFSSYAVVAIRHGVMNAARRQWQAKSIEEASDHNLLDHHEDSRVDIGDIRTLLHQAVKALTPRRRQVLLLRFGLEGGRLLSLGEVAQLLRVSKSRAHQLELGAILRLSAGKSITRIATGLCLERCPCCEQWDEWPCACPGCGQRGCSQCLRWRWVDCDYPSILSCPACHQRAMKKAKKKRTEQASATMASWSDYPFFPLDHC